MRTVNNGKFCPRCGTRNNPGDAYCISCGFAFRGARRRSGLNPIVTILILLILGWIFYRTFLKQPLIPQELLNLTKNITFFKSK